MGTVGIMSGMTRSARCPECNSDDVEVEGFRTANNCSFDVFVCNTCGQIWDDSGEDDFE